VEDYNDQTTPVKLTFGKAAFWIRMIDLPLGCIGREVWHKIGSTVGTVVEIDTDAGGVGWGEYLLVKILLDLVKPLSRGWKMKLEGKSSWITFQYERLPRNFAESPVFDERTQRGEGDYRRESEWSRRKHGGFSGDGEEVEGAYRENSNSNSPQYRTFYS
jgi:hypothetical protein